MDNIIKKKKEKLLSVWLPGCPGSLASRVGGGLETHRARGKSHEGKRKEWFPANGLLIFIVCPKQSELKTQDLKGLTAAWPLSSCAWERLLEGRF